MSKVLRSAKGLPASAVLLAAFVLASCGGDGAEAPAPDAAAPPLESTVAASTPDADTVTQAAAAPVAVPESPLKGDVQPSDAPPAAEPVAVPVSPIKGGAEPTVAQPAYVGTWGVDLGQCAITQDYEQPPMIMRADGFDQHEAHCDFDTITMTGPAEWYVTGQCSVEGDAQPLDYNMAIIDGNLVHWSGNARKEASTLVRCPE